MPHETTENAVIDVTINLLKTLGCVETIHKSGTRDDMKIIATVPDAVARETLKSKLHDLVTPVYVDIQLQ